MVPVAGRRPENNPFATRHVRPGAIPFLFPDGASLAALLDRLKRQQWRGQIVGPHGSGKSTLLAALTAALPGYGFAPHVIELHADRRSLPTNFWTTLASVGSNANHVIDGFEQLGFWARRAVRLACPSSAGLLVTAHRAIGLPNLYRTDVTPDLTRRVISRLLANTSWRPPPDINLAALLSKRRGSLRDLLFDLYDRFEEDRT